MTTEIIINYEFIQSDDLLDITLVRGKEKKIQYRNETRTNFIGSTIKPWEFYFCTVENRISL